MLSHRPFCEIRSSAGVQCQMPVWFVNRKLYANTRRNHRRKNNKQIPVPFAFVRDLLACMRMQIIACLESFCCGISIDWSLIAGYDWIRMWNVFYLKG
jgi:hypothetical protein